MALILNGTLGLSDVDGTAATPAIRGTDTNTGIFFPAADTIAFAEGGVEAMRLDSAGNMGLGTSAPNQRLSLVVTNTTGVSTPILTGQVSTTTLSAINHVTQDSSSGLHALSFSTFNGGNGLTEKMRLDAVGNLLVGATSSSFTLGSGLQIQRAGTATLSLRNSTDSVQGEMWALSAGYYIYSITNHPLVLGTNGTEKARITPAGELLVGTSNASLTGGAGLKFIGNPTEPYMGIVTPATANGNTNYHLYSTGAGAYRFYVGAGGTVFATNTTISSLSDARYKENIRDLDAGLSEIIALQPRKFDWKEGKGANIKNARGFIAQEFEQVFPDLIDEWRDEAPEGEEPYKSVRADLIPVLVKAIQEQQAMIDTLKADVANLKGTA